MKKEFKKINKPFHLRAQMGFAPILLGKYKSEAEAQKAVPVFEAKKYYTDFRIEKVEVEA